MDKNPAMFVADDGERLRAAGLRQILVRRARRAGVAEPSCHSFRRAFARSMHKEGANEETLRRLLGHSDFSQLERYIKLDADDLREIHNRMSPADAV
jgi:site-specific recombinase XerD